MDNPDYITIKEINDWMDAGLVFSFKSLTHDEKHPSKSGKYIQGSEAIALKHEDSLEDYDNTEVVHSSDKSNSLDESKPKKDPNHKYHWTRNIRLCVGKKPIGTPLKIHIDLLVRFNGLKVILP
jgi:hypothetical protein